MSQYLRYNKSGKLLTQVLSFDGYTILVMPDGVLVRYDIKARPTSNGWDFDGDLSPSTIEALQDYLDAHDTRIVTRVMEAYRTTEDLLTLV